MALSSFPEYEADNSSDTVKIELEPQESQMFPLDEFKDGRGLLMIEDEDGKEIATLSANPKSNTAVGSADIQSFTLNLSTGYKVLLPLNTFFGSFDFSMIWPDEEDQGAKQLMLEALKYSDDHFGLKITERGVEFFNMSGKKEYCSLPKDPSAHRSRIESGSNGLFWRNEMAGTGAFSGKINGGRPVYAVTLKEAGLCDKYPYANEDNVGIGIENGIMVVVDGMGGAAFGECASSCVVESLLNSKEATLSRKTIDANERLYVYNRHMYFSTGKMANAVMAAVQVSGDSFKTISVGDSRWVQIRNGKIIKKSRIRSLVGTLLETGQIDVGQALNHPARNMIDTAMMGSFLPDVDSGTMEEGDYFLLFDDGVGMTDKEIEKLMSEEGIDPVHAGKKIVEMTRMRNLLGEDQFQTGDNSYANAPAPRDNLGLIVYRHDKVD